MGIRLLYDENEPSPKELKRGSKRGLIEDEPETPLRDDDLQYIRRAIENNVVDGVTIYWKDIKIVCVNSEKRSYRINFIQPDKKIPSLKSCYGSVFAEYTPDGFVFTPALQELQMYKEPS